MVGALWCLVHWLVDRYGAAVDIRYRGDVTVPIAQGALVDVAELMAATWLWWVALIGLASAWVIRLE